MEEYQTQEDVNGFTYILYMHCKPAWSPKNPPWRVKKQSLLESHRDAQASGDGHQIDTSKSSTNTDNHDHLGAFPCWNMSPKMTEISGPNRSICSCSWHYSNPPKKRPSQIGTNMINEKISEMSGGSHHHIQSMITFNPLVLIRISALKPQRKTSGPHSSDLLRLHRRK